MKSNLLFFATLVALLGFRNTYIPSNPNLGTTVNFVLFTSTGAVGNTQRSLLTGNVGTNGGDISGFGNVNGVMHIADAATTQAALDLVNVYNDLNERQPTNEHSGGFGRWRNTW